MENWSVSRRTAGLHPGVVGVKKIDALRRQNRQFLIFARDVFLTKIAELHFFSRYVLINVSSNSPHDSRQRRSIFIIIVLPWLVIAVSDSFKVSN